MVPFLEPIVIDGVVFCHYICSGVMGRSISSARMDNKSVTSHSSCRVTSNSVTSPRPSVLTVSGSRDHGGHLLLARRGATSHPSRHGVDVVRSVDAATTCRTAEFDDMPVSIDYLRSKYGLEG